MSPQTHQKVVDLLAVAARNIECDLPSIRSHAAPGAETEAAVIRSLEFSLNLMLRAAELAEGDESVQQAIGDRAAAIEATIALCRQNIMLWAEHEAANQSVKH